MKKQILIFAAIVCGMTYTTTAYAQFKSLFSYLELIHKLYLSFHAISKTQYKCCKNITHKLFYSHSVIVSPLVLAYIYSQKKLLECKLNKLLLHYLMELKYSKYNVDSNIFLTNMYYIC